MQNRQRLFYFSFCFFNCSTDDYLTNATTFAQENVKKFLSENGAEYPRFNDILLEKYVRNLIDGKYIPVPRKRASDQNQLIPHSVIPSLNGKIAFVSGGSSGIGRAVAKTLALSGITTVAVARRLDKLLELQTELKTQNIHTLVPMKLDITNKDEVNRNFELTESANAKSETNFCNRFLGSFRKLKQMLVQSTY